MEKFYVKYADAMDLLTSTKPLPPTKLFDDFAILGGEGTAMFVLETERGLVLLDAILPGDAFIDIFETGMRELGYAPEDVTALLVTHGHFDHMGIADYLVDTYGIRFYMSETDYHFGLKDNPERGYEPLHSVPVFLNDDCVMNFGDKNIQVVQTPGHTPGGLSFVIPVRDEGREKWIALWGGTSLPKETRWKRAYKESLSHFKMYTDACLVEGEICAHPFMDNTHEKIALQRNRIYGVPNPFLMGREGYLRYAGMLMEMTDEALASDSGTGMREQV